MAKNIEEIKNLIEKIAQENELINRNIEAVLKGFLTFDFNYDLKYRDKLIIKEFTKNTFYEDLNKWLMNMDLQFNSYEAVAYFSARLIYSLNSYGGNGNYYNKNNTKLFRGCKLPFTNLLQYKKANGKIITFSAFTSTNEEEMVAYKFSGRKQSQMLFKRKSKFSVVFYITNHYKQNWFPNGVNIQDISLYKYGKEIVFLPFSFYYVIEVQIDLKNYKADVYLDTIGKYKILEEQIKNGKDIIFNKYEGVMEIN